MFGVQASRLSRSASHHAKKNARATRQRPIAAGLARGGHCRAAASLRANSALARSGELHRLVLELPLRPVRAEERERRRLVVREVCGPGGPRRQVASALRTRRTQGLVRRARRSRARQSRAICSPFRLAPAEGGVRWRSYSGSRHQTGRPAEPPTLATAVANWRPDTIPLGGSTLRVVALRDDDGDAPPVLIVEEIA